MAEDIRNQEHLTAEQCRKRAMLVRHTAAAVKSALLRDDLLGIATQYDRLAETRE